MKILVVARDVPATNMMAGSPRLFSLCKVLSRHHQLSLITPQSNVERYDTFLNDPSVAGVFEDLTLLPSAYGGSWAGKQLHRFRQEAYFVTRYRAPQFFRDTCNTLREKFVNGGYDLIYADDLLTAQYVVGIDIPVAAVIDLHDSVTMLYTRKAALEPKWLQRLRIRLEVRSIARWESSLSRSFGLIVTNSPVDEDFLRALDPSANTMTIGNGVDTEFFHAASHVRNPHTMIFTGVMSYAPNEDAAVYFADEVLPRIVQRFPDAVFKIVGAKPSEKIRQLAERPNIALAAEVPDIRPYLDSSGVFVSPLRWGAGVKNKVLAALSMEMPVVASPRSLDGLTLRPEEHLLAAATPDEWVSQIARIFDDPALGKAMGRSGRAYVQSQYSWERNGAELERAMIALVAHGKARQRTIV